LLILGTTFIPVMVYEENEKRKDVLSGALKAPHLQVGQ
jgi:hypothetical protein